jgi:DNA replication protein DnaC
MRTTSREPSRCAMEDCYEQATERWGSFAFCPEHAAAARRQAVKRGLAALRREAGKHTSEWRLETFPADDAVGSRALEAARRWLEYERHEFGSSLFIYGPQGTGKTSLAFSCAVELVEEYPGEDLVRFVNTKQMLGRMRRSFGEDETYDPTEELLEAAYVVLDDLGAERPTEWAREVLATIIEGRYVDEAPMIVTANYSPSMLAKRLGHDDPMIGLRLVSRLTENAMQIELKRDDLRTRRA